MGTEYTLYCEAKIGDKWYNIDFYQRKAEGDLQLTPIIYGKSAIGSAFQWYAQPTQIGKESLSPDTLMQEGSTTQDWQWKYIPGSWFIDKDLDAPEYCGYFPRQEILDYKAGMTDMICSDDMLDTEAYLALPDDGKVAYQYFEWTEEWGSRYVMRLIKNAVECRIRAANEWLWTIPKEVRGNTGGIWWSDVRVIVFVS